MIYHRIIATLLITTATLTATAQRLHFDTMERDCGKSGYMMPVTAKFELKNRGLRHVSIIDLKADCGCSKAESTKNNLGPGDKTTITLTYDGKQLGHYVKRVAIYNSATDEPVYLTMKGIVVEEVKDYTASYPYAMGELLADQNELFFDNVNKGDKPIQVIHIINNGQGTMTPNVQHLPDYLTAIAIPEQLRPGQAGEVQLTLNSEKIRDFGLTQSTVHMAAHLGDKVTSDTELPVSIVALPDLKTFDGKNKQYAPKMYLSADTVSLGMIDGKKRKSAIIIITNMGRTELNISSLQMFTPGLKITLDKTTLGAGEQTKMKIKGDRDILLKQRTKPRILMITNDPDHAKMILPIIVK